MKTTLKDLTKQQFGKLTVIERAEDYISPKGKHLVQWLCQCECGNQIIVLGNRLKSLSVKSCGCDTGKQYKNNSKYKNLYGQQFGFLVPIEYMGNSKWKCECHCGRKNCKKIKITSTKNLKNGDTKTCGCVNENRYELSPNGCVGYTAKEEPFYFDLDDYNKIKDIYWRITNVGYVVGSKEGKIVLMHRIVMDAPDYKNQKLDVDHINHCTVDNRKNNLRLISHQQNLMNQKVNCNNKCKHKGIYYDKERNKWRAEIEFNQKKYRLGRFDTIEEAIEARKQAEKELFGEFAYQENNSVT